MIWLRALLFTVFLPGTVTVLIPYLLVMTWGGVATLSLGRLRLLGVAPLLLGMGGYIRCTYDFVTLGRGTPAPWDPPKHLVVSGLYRYVRNPIYVSILLALVGEFVLFEATILLAYSAFAFLAFHLRVVFFEEPTLLESFGESYQRYCAAVPRWLPRGGRKQ